MEDDRARRIRELFHAALDVPDGRDEFVRRESHGDSAVADAVNELVALHDSVQHPAPSPDHDDWPGSRVGPYRVVREIGAGGMGRVYLARRDDGAFERVVAIKRLDRRRADGDAQARFEQERRILADLSHPCIAELIDAGRTSGGELYFVMEYVDGPPLTRFADDRDLSPRERIELFRRVCDAVSAAHRTLIVHRDIKPNNILVDAAGVPKLLDFGIARLVTAGGLDAGKPTDPLYRRATPGYASPEHIEGAPAHVGMDVFSLGVVLHELLTGRKPGVSGDQSFGDPTEHARSVGAPAVRPDLGADLDAILAKCLSVDVQARYRSVEQLSEDLGAFLEDRPVSARSHTTWDRARQFVRRNRAASITAGSAAAVLIVGIASLVLLLIDMVGDRARQQAMTEQAGDLAAATFDVEQWLRSQSGSIEHRRRLVVALDAYLTGLAGQDDTALALETAESLRRLGDIWGSPASANLGDAGRAAANYNAALDVLERLSARGGNTSEIQSSRARVYVALADLHAYQGDVAGANAQYRQALTLAESLLALDSERPEFRALAAGVHRPVSDLRLAEGDLEGARNEIDRALALDLSNVLAASQDPEYRRLAILDYLRIARIHGEAGDLDRALESYRETQTHLEWLSSAGHDSSVVRRDAAIGRAQLAQLLEASGDYDGAAEVMSGVVDDLRDLTRHAGVDVRARRDLVVALVQQADLHWAEDNTAAARTLAEARQVAIAMTADPSNERAAVDLDVVDQRIAALGRGSQRADLRLFRVDQGRRVLMGPADRPALRTSIEAVATAPPGWTDYLVVFGAEGPADLVEVGDANESDWRLVLTGPPPTQTILLLSVPRALSQESRRQLLSDIEALPQPRLVGPEESITWAFNTPRIESLLSPRGSHELIWVNALRDRIARLGQVAVAGHTFSLSTGMTR